MNRILPCSVQFKNTFQNFWIFKVHVYSAGDTKITSIALKLNIHIFELVVFLIRIFSRCTNVSIFIDCRTIDD